MSRHKRLMDDDAVHDRAMNFYNNKIDLSKDSLFYRGSCSLKMIETSIYGQLNSIMNDVTFNIINMDTIPIPNVPQTNTQFPIINPPQGFMTDPEATWCFIIDMMRGMRMGGQFGYESWVSLMCSYFLSFKTSFGKIFVTFSFRANRL